MMRLSRGRCRIRFDNSCSESYRHGFNRHQSWGPLSNASRLAIDVFPLYIRSVTSVTTVGRRCPPILAMGPSCGTAYLPSVPTPQPYIPPYRGVSFVAEQTSVVELFRDIRARSSPDWRQGNIGMNERHDLKPLASICTEISRTYLSLTEEDAHRWIDTNNPKLQLIRELIDDRNGVDMRALELSIKNASERGEHLSLSSVRRMRDLCAPRYEAVLDNIVRSSQDDLGVAFLVRLRSDVQKYVRYMRFMSKSEDACKGHDELLKLQNLDSSLRITLSSLFRPGVLKLERITFDETPASIIEQIALKEQVHPNRSLSELRARLGEGRRCFAFFSPSLHRSPLIFVHVALLNEIPATMDEIRGEAEKPLGGDRPELSSTCATFYSISNTEPGLAGVHLGNELIKSVMKTLQLESSTLMTFCTLSPIPKFGDWLESKLSYSTLDDIRRMLNESDLTSIRNFYSLESSPCAIISFAKTLSDLKKPSRSKPECLESISPELKPILMKLAAYYLTKETRHGRPLCPVAKFHIRNGACMFRLNYAADVSSKGIRNSFGIMINYLYKMDDIEDNRVQYELSGRVVSNEGVSRWL